MAEELKPLPHHRKVGPCLTRPPYRDGKRNKAVKVFTIADESMYLLIFGVPSIDLSNLLTEKIQQISPIQSIRKIDYPDPEAYTDTYLLKFATINFARNVKRRLDDTSFYGGILHIVYAPEYETVSECRSKIHTYRQINDTIAKKAAIEKQREIKDYNRRSEESLQIPDGQQPSTFISIPSSSLATGVNVEKTTLSNPYSVPLPTPLSSHSNAQQVGEANKTQHSLSNSIPPVKTIPLAVQQALLCQPILKEDNPVLKRPAVSISKDLIRFTPRSVIQAQRLPPRKKGKLK
nr:hypothetical transcript [Hymenolepis microstoma]